MKSDLVVPPRIRVTAFFKLLGFTFRNPVNSWGAVRGDVVLLKQFEHDLVPDTDFILLYGPKWREPRVPAGLNERLEQLSMLESGTSSGYLVMQKGQVLSDGREIKADFDRERVYPIRAVFRDQEGRVFGALNDPISVAEFARGDSLIRTENVDGPVLTAASPEIRFALIRIRTEQSTFRRKVYALCKGRCVVSGCAVVEALEAAHLRGRSWGAGHNAEDDGILLRRDLHALFDRGLLDISPDGTVSVKDGAMSDYAALNGAKASLPSKVIAALGRAA